MADRNNDEARRLLREEHFEQLRRSQRQRQPQQPRQLQRSQPQSHTQRRTPRQRREPRRREDARRPAAPRRARSPSPSPSSTLTRRPSDDTWATDAAVRGGRSKPKLASAERGGATLSTTSTAEAASTTGTRAKKAARLIFFLARGGGSRWRSPAKASNATSRQDDAKAKTAAKKRKKIAALLLYLGLYLCFAGLWMNFERGHVFYYDGNESYHGDHVTKAVSYSDDFLESPVDSIDDNNSTTFDYSSGTANSTTYDVCGREAKIEAPDARYGACPKLDPKKKTLILSNHRTYGQTGNQLHAFLQAVQYARDNDLQLGVEIRSWAIDLISSMWMARKGNVADWASFVERTLCVKIFHSMTEARHWNVAKEHGGTLSQRLFYYHSPSPEEDYEASQKHALWTLFRYHNVGEGHDTRGRPVNDMCSAIDSLFGAKDRGSAKYSVIHLRHLEGKHGTLGLARQSKLTGCDPRAALWMEPSYVKPILESLEMLKRPIVIIHDGQNMKAVERLAGDPEIGPRVRFVPEDSCWFGGDVTLAVMADVFIGNPASTMSLFIARSRAALGTGRNYLWRAKDGEGMWRTVCGDECLFRKQTEKVYFWEGWPQRRKHSS